MSNLPQVAQLEFPASDLATTAATDLGKTFLYDFKSNDFVLDNGKLTEVTDIDALKVWVEKVLKTEKFKFKIYNKPDTVNEYGVTIMDLIFGYDYPIEYVASEIKREVTEALMKHPRIQGLDNWNVEKDNPVLKVAFKINLVDGSSVTQEVNY